MKSGSCNDLGGENGGDEPVGGGAKRRPPPCVGDVAPWHVDLVDYLASGLSCSSSKSRCWWACVQAETWNHVSATKTAAPTTPPVTNPATAEWLAAMVASRPAAEPVRTAVTTPIIPAVVRKAGQYPLRKPRMASRRDGGTLAR
jgi:hypothetical protein